MTVAGLIQLFDVRGLPLHGLHEMELALAHQHKLRAPLTEIDQALYWALRTERLARAHTATIVPAVIAQIEEGADE